MSCWAPVIQLGILLSAVRADVRAAVAIFGVAAWVANRLHQRVPSTVYSDSEITAGLSTTEPCIASATVLVAFAEEPTR